MKKTLIFIGVIIIIVVGYWFVSPFFIDKKVSESLPTVAVNNIDLVTDAKNEDNPLQEKVKVNSNLVNVKTGSFTGFDKIHTGSGTASLVSIGDKKYIRFEDDFVVANGPDLYVGLGKDGKYIKGSEIGKLKGNIGSQNYELPADTNLEDIDEVWVWCKAFAVPFSKAVLN